MTAYAGFDLGGTQLKYGLVTETGEILFRSKVNTPEKIQDLMQLIKKLWDSLNKEETITAAGFAFPGIFSRKEQRILQSPNYSELDKFDLVRAIGRHVDVPFYINNDANLAAYGEYKKGAGINAHSMIHFTIGTGVGSGIILQGKIWEGVSGFAGELGHIIVNPDGERCLCGSQGCLETEASAQKIVKNYNDLTGKKEELTSKDVAQRAQKGDEEARKAFARAGYFLGIGIGISINFLNPEKILLGGGVMKSGDLLLEPAKREARKRSYQATYQSCSIEPAILGNDAGFIGAALYAMDRLKT